MGPDLIYPPGATPLDPDELAELIPRHVATQAQLNEWEHQNVTEGHDWVSRARVQNVLSSDFMRTLHEKMFGSTWRWAGRFRGTEKNIGVAPEQVAIRTQELLDNVKFQLEHHSYPVREIAARFHHRLVQIHPFPNGNGRFARMLTDQLLIRDGQAPFSWGEADLVAAGDVRTRYIDALRAADAGDYAPLFRFLDV